MTSDIVVSRAHCVTLAARNRHRPTLCPGRTRMTSISLPKRLFRHTPSGHGGPGYAFIMNSAVNVFTGSDRRAPEGTALALWLDQTANLLGLETIPLPDGKTFSRQRVGQGVPPPTWHGIGNTLTAALDAVSPDMDTPAALWLAALARVLGLDSLDVSILSLALHYRGDQRFMRLYDMLSEARGGDRSLGQDPALVGLLLRAEPEAVEARIATDGRLLTTGLLLRDRGGDLEVFDRLPALIRGGPPCEDLYGRLLGPALPATLPWASFTHLRQHAGIAADVLRAALADREPGIHILLYGPAGTGKTSFAATLAAHVGARLRPVAEQDDRGAEPDRKKRLSSLTLAQHLAPPGEVLLFDEAEDLFLHSSRSGDGPAASRVFMHRLLERSATPVIWTANNIGALGPAVLRRMTLCLELKVPDVATRSRLWREMAAGEGIALPDADATRLARLVAAAPALASSALRAARLAGGGADTARQVVEGVARAMAGGALPAPQPDADGQYDPALVNADADLATLEAGLLRPGATQAVSLLLSGPPGTGKSAWVRHLAGRMGLEVLHKRASDLFDPFVGVTEQRIAAAFAEAQEAGAFLVFDEADSLLAERGDAVRSWEVRQVNEMLTWMEAHPLPFACTTNLLDRLDRASLRRFLVKLRFGWLDAGQARRAFEGFFGVRPSPGLDGLGTLTPADFALVRRRAEVTGEGADAGALVRMLAAECEGRVGGRLSIGFERYGARE